MVSAAITGSVQHTMKSNSYAAGAAKADKGSFDNIIAETIDISLASSRTFDMTPDADKKTLASLENSKALSSSKNVSDGKELNNADNGTKNVNDKAVDETEASDDVEITDEMKESVEKAVSDIIDKIKAVLGISDEELNRCMEELGLSMMQLLEPGNIVKLIMEATGTKDAMQFATDGDMSEALKDILDFVSQVTDNLSKEFNMTQNELKAAVKDFSDAYNAEAGNEALEQPEKAVATDSGIDNAHKDSLDEAVASKITVNDEAKGTSENQMGHTDDNSGGHNGENKANMADAGTAAGNVVQQLSQAFETAFSANAETVSPADIVRQIVDSIRLTNANTLQSMEIQLTPENLGKVNILVSVREGVITAEIATQNEQVKRAIEGQLATLKESFENQGIKVDSVEVTVQSNAFDSSQEFADNREQERTSKARRRINPDELNFDDDKETEEQSIIVNENSSVEYSA